MNRKLYLKLKNGLNFENPITNESGQRLKGMRLL